MNDAQVDVVGATISAHGCLTSTVDVITGINIQRSNIPLSLCRIDSRKPEFHGLTIAFLSSLTANMQRRDLSFCHHFDLLEMSFKAIKDGGIALFGDNLHGVCREHEHAALCANAGSLAQRRFISS